VVFAALGRVWTFAPAQQKTTEVFRNLGGLTRIRVLTAELGAQHLRAHDPTLQEVQALGLGNRLRPVMDAQFAVDIAGVDFYRVQGEAKPLSDLAV
jgi:hypothetical protein